MKTLTIAAHPDDEILGAGGTLARISNEGNEVYIAIMGEGIASRYSQRDGEIEDLIDKLNNNSRKAAKSIGAKGIFFYNLPDNRFDSRNILDIIRSIEELVIELNPDVIYTHHASDLNIDHKILFRAVLTATRPIQDQSVREIYSFEIPSATEWSFQSFEPNFKPNVFVDISKTLDIKLKALSIYESEMREFPHPRSHKAIVATANRWGSIMGCEAAEAFELIRAFR